jgi:geranylgeranyl diphosphate synthase type I
MKEIINNYSYQIKAFLESFLDEKSSTNIAINQWGQDVIKRLKNFSVNGKMIRGSLILFTEAMYGKANDIESIKLAAAIELFHSGLLIHDDIIDGDDLRRGKPSLHYQYQTACADGNIVDPDHFGISMGICAGDIVFFIGFDLLSRLKIDNDFKDKIFHLFIQEFTNVGFGQMQDIYFGLSNSKLEEDDILKLYLYKTARYTFSLPFLLGGWLAKTSDSELVSLERLGEYIGLIFQIKDDELCIFPEEAESGKSTGSDIKGEKKTLFYFYIFQRASQEEKKKLCSIFGSPNISKESLKYVQDLIHKYAIRRIIERKYHEYKIKALEIISLMNIDNVYKEMLYNIVNYNITRRK